jgi:hypothetical protein
MNLSKRNSGSSSSVCLYNRKIQIPSTENRYLYAHVCSPEHLRSKEKRERMVEQNIYGNCGFYWTKLQWF